jgi:hypothetical protein
MTNRWCLTRWTNRKVRLLLKKEPNHRRQWGPSGPAVAVVELEVEAEEAVFPCDWRAIVAAQKVATTQLAMSNTNLEFRATADDSKERRGAAAN